jgi:hypothetical protein
MERTVCASMPPATIEPLKLGTVPEVYTMPLLVHAPLAVRDIRCHVVLWQANDEYIQSRGPCVPRYVTTGWGADLGVGLAIVTLATARKVVKMEVNETMVAVCRAML